MATVRTGKAKRRFTLSRAPITLMTWMAERTLTEDQSTDPVIRIVLHLGSSYLVQLMSRWVDEDIALIVTESG